MDLDETFWRLSHMTGVKNKFDLSKIKYVKLVNYTQEQRDAWSYKEFENGSDFDLHWSLNADQEAHLSDVEFLKMRNAKKTNANKANPGDMILLFQNHIKYGHRFTHAAEVISSKAKAEDDKDYWTRKVKVIWTHPSENWNIDFPPETKKIIGSLFKFRNGYLVQIGARTINFNLEYLSQLTSDV
jgi:hypothetical protein